MTLKIAFATALVSDRWNASIILCHNSDAFERKLTERRTPRDHGFEDLPSGIRVFEGSMVRDAKCRYVGAMRPPTTEELTDLAGGKCPWPMESDAHTVRELLCGFEYPVTPEDWTAIYVAESIAIDLGGPHPDIAARVLEIYAGVDPKGGETSALVRLFLDTAPPSMLARAELFIRKPYAILQFLWALETKVEKLEGDSISGIAPLRTALERLQKETTDKNLRKPLEKILVALRGKETQ